MAIIQTTGKITEIRELSKTVKHFVIDIGKNLEMKAGQFINLSFEKDGKTYKKPYSIASPPTFNQKTNKIELCIKLVKDGTLTPKLWELQTNDSINIMGPLGLFTLEKLNPKKKILFIGTGTGIAPLRSMIYDLIEKQKYNKEQDFQEITLLFGIRFENEILYEEEFKKLAEQNPNFKYIQVVSKPTKNWTGRTGHVQDNLGNLDIQNSQAYMCGLPQMIEETKNKLIQLGMAQEDIHHEIFK